MEDSGDADAYAEIFRIRSDGQHRLRCCPEQKIVDKRLVLERNVGDLGRQREYDMEVADRQQVGLTFRPSRPRGCCLAFGTMSVAAGVVGDAPVAAVLAGFNVTAESCGAAVLDR